MGSDIYIDESTGLTHSRKNKVLSFLSEEMLGFENSIQPSRELCVSFEYQCNVDAKDTSLQIDELENIGIKIPSTIRRNSSFSCLSGAALSANATLANTNMLNGLIGQEILPSLDSPNSFRPLSSSPSLSRLDPLSSSQSNISALVGSLSNDSDFLENDKDLSKTMSTANVEASTFLNAMMDVQVAGGAAGEDRLQAVCSEENGWLFCGVYDGFNGRDAADFLAVTLYENIAFYLHLLHENQGDAPLSLKSSLEGIADNQIETSDNRVDRNMFPKSSEELSSEPFRHGVMDCLRSAVVQAENDFMRMVEQEMEERPDLVSVGSCVLIVLLHGKDLYVLNLGDSRAVLATIDASKDGLLQAVQLTETHTVDNRAERNRLLAEHPYDPSTITGGKVKGKLKVSRAFGVGYLKKKIMNDALMGILRVHNLCSPPYVSTEPSTVIHQVSDDNLFVVIGSDGLFDFFTNNEVVHLVYLFIRNNPFGDPAKYLLEELLLRAAEKSGMTAEELIRIPAGRRRKYHDDVTVVVIMLGHKQRTTTASTTL
ncbi:putative protein phosphatase 2C 39 [Nymphaea thermarum]|nr:putative protein phosphatase 2C 39 [Nymphaea thermarum]